LTAFETIILEPWETNMTSTTDSLSLDRRHLVGAAVTAAASVQLGMFAAVAALGTSVAPGYAQQLSRQKRKVDIDLLEIDPDITLRRMVVRNPNPKGTVLFLHGFPETLYAWKDIALARR
jgi:hypothetical protein